MSIFAALFNNLELTSMKKMMMIAVMALFAMTASAQNIA
jgi:hypothetical protein